MKSSQNLELIILGIVLIISIFVICMVLCVPKAYGEGFSAGNYKSLRRMALRSAPNGLTSIERLRLAREHVENREKNVDGK